MNERVNTALKYIWKAAGYGVVLLSVWFIARRFSGPEFVSLLSEMPLFVFLLLGLFLFSYSLCNFLPAISWALFLQAMQPGLRTLRSAVGLYLRSGIVKYLPGNVFHFAGRHVMGKGLGVSQGDILKANILEVAGIVLCAGCIIVLSLIGGSLVIPGNTVIAANLETAAWIAAAGTAAGIVLLFHEKVRRYVGKLLSPDKWRSYMMVFLLYGAFFGITGLVLQGTLVAVSQTAVFRIDDTALFVAVFSLSWIAGFVIPGAPGGLGVREFIILLMLGPGYGETPALSAALLLRVITVGGDVLSFLYSFIFSLPGENE